MSAAPAGWPGRPLPLGATVRDGGTNFAVASEVAGGITLCLFDAAGTETLQAEVNSEGLIEFGDEGGRQLANPLANAFDGHGADLLGPRFSVTGQPGLASGQ